MPIHATTDRTTAGSDPDVSGSAVGRTSRMDHLSAELDDLKELEEDWDSYGARRITYQAIERASQVIGIANSDLGPVLGDDALPSAAFPVPTGGVALEWSRPNGLVSVVVGPEGELGYLLKTVRDGRSVYEERHGLSVGDLMVLIAHALVPER